MHNKEMRMIRFAVAFVFLTIFVGLGHVPRATATVDTGSNYSLWPRVVATVITLEPRGMATVRTVDGTTYEVVKGTTWQVGDTVTCEYTTRGRASWQALDCRKTS
jgi:hypothetical protein